MKSWIGTGFLAPVSGLWLVKELTPVVFISFGDFRVLLFAFVSKGAFRGSERGWFVPELRNPPFFNIGALARKPLQALENTQQVFCNMGMSVRRVLRNEGARSV